MAEIRVRLSTTGSQRVMQALSGLRRALGVTARTADRQTRQTVRNADQEARAVENSEERKQRAVRDTEREQEMSYERILRRQRRRLERQRLIERARAQIADEEAAAAARPSRMRRFGAGLRGMVNTGATMAGGALLGGGRALLGVGREVQGAMGIRSQLDIIGGMVDARQNFIRGAVQAGVHGPQIQGMIERSAQIGQRTGVSPEEIMTGIVRSQEQFSMLDTAVRGGESGVDEFFSNMEYFAQVSRTTGSSMEEVIGAAGAFQRQFNLSSTETREAMAVLAEGALTGSLTLNDFSERFPAAIASFIGARGVTGTEGMREFQALAQAFRAADVDPRVARTYQENLLGALSNRRASGRLRRLGINALDRDGRVRSMGDIVSQAADSPRAQVLGNLITAFGNQDAARGFLMLVQQEQRARDGQGGAMTLSERMNVDMEHGAQMFDATMRELNQDASGDVIRMRINREAQLVEKSDELIARFGALAGALTTIEDRLGPEATTIGAPVLEGAVGGMGLASLMSRLGGSTAAAGSGGGVLAASVGSGGILAAAGGIAAAVGAGIAIAGVVAAGISATGMFEDQRGRSLMDQVYALPEDASRAFAGGVWESITNAFGGQAQLDMTAVRRAQDRQRAQQVTIDQAGANRIAAAVQNGREPGAGRREEGSQGR